MKRMQEMESNASSERDEVCCYFYQIWVEFCKSWSFKKLLCLGEVVKRDFTCLETRGNKVERVFGGRSNV